MKARIPELLIYMRRSEAVSECIRTAFRDDGEGISIFRICMLLEPMKMFLSSMVFLFDLSSYISSQYCRF